MEGASDIPDADIRVLPPAVRAEIAGFGEGLGQDVGRLLAAAAEALNEDPCQAMRLAARARSMVPRSGAVREALGVAAYRCGDYQVAKRELQAARRISGGSGLLPLLADCERGLGDPQRALDLGRSGEARKLGGEEAAEMLMVLAGARMDMGQARAAAAVVAQAAARSGDEPWSCRIRYVYAAALEAAGDAAGAEKWFRLAATADSDGLTDAAERAESLARQAGKQ